MEARMIKAGRREYVRVLRLLETFDIDDLHAAVKKALQLGAVGFDAVKHLVLCHVEKRPPKLIRCLPIPATGERRDHIRGQLYGPDVGGCSMTVAPKILLADHLKTLKLPTFLREYDKLAANAPPRSGSRPVLARLVELELIDRERRMIERRIKAAKFPAAKSPTASTSRRFQS